MRVTWLVYGDLEQPTGGYVYDRLVVAGLRAAGDDVAVVDPRDAGHAAPARLTGDVLVGDALGVAEVGPLFEAAAGSARRVLLVHHLPSWEEERTDREALRALEARAIAASDRAVVTSATTGARLGGEYPGLGADVVVPGADRLPRRPRAERSGALRLVFVGSVIPRKRLHLLFDALERLGDTPFTLHMAGDAGRDPAHAAAMRARVHRSPALRGRVVADGVLDDGALADRLASVDALVLPSSLEGYGMVIAEALATGLPVFAARPAAVAAGVAGHPAVAVFDDSADLAAALETFARDEAVRAAMTRAAGSASLPTWEGCVAAFRAALASGRG